MTERRTAGAVGALAVAGALATTIACGKEPTRPVPMAQAAAGAPIAGRLAVSTERARAVQAALEDARRRALQSAVTQLDARAELDDDLAALAAKLDARDKTGVEQSLRVARDALARYRATLGKDAGVLPDIEAIAVTLEAVQSAIADDKPDVSAPSQSTPPLATPKES